MSLAAVNRTTLREQVVDNLRAAILDGTFPPGTKMGEVDLATQFGVSRGTVREALRTLHNAGLLEGSERNSLFVRQLASRDIRELFELRSALEGQAVANVMGLPNADEVIDELERHLPEAPLGLTYAQRFEIDLQFHEKLLALSANRMLNKVWDDVKDLMRITALAAEGWGGDDSIMTRAHHQPIIDAMRSGNVEEARLAMAAHMAAAAEKWGG